MNTIATVSGILVLATLAEALVEHLISPVLPDGAGWRALALRYTAAAVGIILCLLYSADLLLLLDLTPPWPWVGYIITGLLVGRGSNFVHDFATRWQSAA